MFDYCKKYIVDRENQFHDLDNSVYDGKKKKIQINKIKIECFFLLLSILMCDCVNHTCSLHKR